MSEKIGLTNVKLRPILINLASSSNRYALDLKYKKIEDSLTDVSFMMPSVKITFLSNAGPIQMTILEKIESDFS